VAKLADAPDLGLRNHRFQNHFTEGKQSSDIKLGSSRWTSSLVAGILTGGGCRQAVIVDGGMDAWISQGLSVVRKRRFWNLSPNTSKAVNIDADAGGGSLIVRKAP